MTTTLELVTAHLDTGDLDPGLHFSTAREQVERVAALVEQYGTAAYIYAGERWSAPRPAAAVIPVALAEELIKEGRIGWPLYTSRTVVAPR